MWNDILNKMTSNDRNLIVAIKEKSDTTEASVKAIVNQEDFRFTNDTGLAVLEAVRSEQTELLPILLSKHHNEDRISLDNWIVVGYTALDFAWINNDYDAYTLLQSHGASEEYIPEARIPTKDAEGMLVPLSPNVMASVNDNMMLIKPLCKALITGGQPLGPVNNVHDDAVEKAVERLGAGLINSYQWTILNSLDVATALLSFEVIFANFPIAQEIEEYKKGNVVKNSVLDKQGNVSAEKLLLRLMIITIIASKIGLTHSDLTHSDDKGFPNKLFYSAFGIDENEYRIMSKANLRKLECDTFVNRFLHEKVNPELYKLERVTSYYDFLRGNVTYGQMVEKHVKPPVNRPS
ncbi:MAG: hypothetical protein ACHQAX_05055 [Gammaproteobacteria bacterium]